MPSRDAVRAYAERRWDLVAKEKRRFAVERYRRGGPAVALEAAARLRERWAELHPEGASPASRAADLAHHVALKEKLDRTRHVVSRR